MLTSYEAVRYFIEENGPLWRLSHLASGDQKVNKTSFEYNPENGANFTDSLNKLDRVLPTLSGSYRIMVSGKALTGNEPHTEFFSAGFSGLGRNAATPAPQPVVAVSGIPGLDISKPESLTEYIQKEVERRLKDKEFEETKAKLALLEKEREEPGVFEQIIGRIWEVGEPFITSVLAQKSALSKVAGIEIKENIKTETMEDENIVIDEKEVELCENAIQILFPIDPELGTHLNKLAEIAVKQPKKFKMLLGMLENF